MWDAKSVWEPLRKDLFRNPKVNRDQKGHPPILAAMDASLQVAALAIVLVGLAFGGVGLAPQASQEEMFHRSRNP